MATGFDSQVESLAAIADRSKNSTDFPNNCDFYVDREKSLQMDEQSESYGLTVSRA